MITAALFTDKDSEHEAAFIRCLMAFASHLPAPEREVRLLGYWKDRVDFLFRDEKLVIEIDGGQWMSGGGRHNSSKDREKVNALTALGYRVLRYSGDMIRSNPEYVADQVRAMVLGEVWKLPLKHEWKK